MCKTEVNSLISMSEKKVPLLLHRGVHLAFVLEGRQVLLLRTTSAVYIPHPVGTGLTLGIDVVTRGAVLVYLWRQDIVYNNML